MKFKLRYSSLARRDFIAVADWSQAQWGARQTRRYLIAIEAQIQRIVENPMLGAEADLPHPSLRKITAGRHTIFYIASDREVQIVRIMHQLQDHPGGLGLK